MHLYLQHKKDKIMAQKIFKGTFGYINIILSNPSLSTKTPKFIRYLFINQHFINKYLIFLSYIVA